MGYRRGGIDDNRPTGPTRRDRPGPKRTLAALTLLVTLATPVVAVGGSVDGFSSPNVRFVKNIPLAAGAAEGGRRVGDYFYVTVNAQGLLIFDVSDPFDPVLVGRAVLPHAFENEDVATNGKIAALSQLGDSTYAGAGAASLITILDVTDKTYPRPIATLPGAGDHTLSCLYDCTWLYGANGTIVDLREPEHPELVPHRWFDGLSIDPSQDGHAAHDVTEVRPGLVLTASIPMFLLDTTDPAKPKVLASSDGSPSSYHNVSWPNQGTDRFILSVSEPVPAPHPDRCETREVADEIDVTAFKTWDSTAWVQFGLRPIDVWRVERNGTYLDGSPAVSPPQGCGQHWFEVSPDYRNGGLVAEASYGHGVRFLNVDRHGFISEVGHFLGSGANTSAVYWMSENLVYAVDVHRGIDIIQIDR